MGHIHFHLHLIIIDSVSEAQELMRKWFKMRAKRWWGAGVQGLAGPGSRLGFWSVLNRREAQSVILEKLPRLLLEITGIR